MIQRIGQWRTRRRQWREAAAAFNEAEIVDGLMPTDRYFIRRLTFESLVRGHNAATTLVDRAILIAEIERRKAWDAPAGWAIRISIASLCIAAASLAFSLFR